MIAPRIPRNLRSPFRSSGCSSVRAISSQTTTTICSRTEFLEIGARICSDFFNHLRKSGLAGSKELRLYYKIQGGDCEVSPGLMMPKGFQPLLVINIRKNGS